MQFPLFAKNRPIRAIIAKNGKIHGYPGGSQVLGGQSGPPIRLFQYAGLEGRNSFAPIYLLIFYQSVETL